MGNAFCEGIADRKPKAAPEYGVAFVVYGSRIGRMSDTDNVVMFPGATSLDIPPDRVLAGAMEKLELAIVIGVDKDGDLYFAASTADDREINWLLDMAKRALFDTPDR